MWNIIKIFRGGPAFAGAIDLRARLLDLTDTPVGAEINTGFGADLGNGQFRFTYASMPDGFRGSMIFYRAAFPAELVAISINGDDEIAARSVNGLVATSSGGGFAGPHALEISFVDADNDPVPNVVFSVVPVGVGIADTDGIATIGLPDGTFTIAASPMSGIVFPVTVVVVAGVDQAIEIQGAGEILPVPSDPAAAVLYVYCRQPNGAPEAGVKFSYRLLTPPEESGASYDNETRFETAVSDAAGLLQIQVMRLSRYTVKRNKKEYTIDVGNVAAQELPLVLAVD